MCPMRCVKYLILLPLLLSCERVQVPQVPEDDTVYHDMIQLGERLEDPFEVENVTKAFESLYPSKAGRVGISPTDIYVRFLPRTEEEYRRLAAAVPSLLDHPVDYRIVREGDYYHDPSVPEGEITWQYAVVPIGFKFPDGIEHEVLHKCYIVEHDAATRASSDVDWQAVEREAYRLTGNGDMLAASTKASSAPSGRITVVDAAFNEGKPFGVAGVMVACNSFVKFSSTYTDRDGYYAMPVSFTGSPRYRLVFKNKKGFSLGFNLVLIPASISTLGKGEPEGLDANVLPSDNSLLFRRCVVNNAAYEFYTRCTQSDLDILPPPQGLVIWILSNLSGSCAVMLHQGTMVEVPLLSERYGEYMDLLNVFLPDITIGCKNHMDSYSEIYSIAVHELSHASHFVQAGEDYWKEYVGYVLETYVRTGDAYGEGRGDSAGYCDLGETWAYFMESTLFKERYGGGLPDLGTSWWFRPQILRYLYERGMTRGEMYKALKEDVCSMEDFQDELVTLYPDKESQIRQVFNRYGK